MKKRSRRCDSETTKTKRCSGGNYSFLSSSLSSLSSLSLSSSLYIYILFIFFLITPTISYCNNIIPTTTTTSNINNNNNNNHLTETTTIIIIEDNINNNNNVNSSNIELLEVQPQQETIIKNWGFELSPDYDWFDQNVMIQMQEKPAYAFEGYRLLLFDFESYYPRTSYNVSQQVTLPDLRQQPNTLLSLDFAFKILQGGNPPTTIYQFLVKVDSNNNVFMIDSTTCNITSTPDYSLLSLDITKYADGQKHNITFQWNVLLSSSADSIIYAIDFISIYTKPSTLLDYNIYVSNINGDDLNNNGTIEYPFATIQHAIDWIAEDRTIYVDALTNYELESGQSIFSRGKNISIIGDNTLITGVYSFVFVIQPPPYPYQVGPDTCPILLPLMSSVITIGGFTMTNGSVDDAAYQCQLATVLKNSKVIFNDVSIILPVTSIPNRPLSYDYGPRAAFCVRLGEIEFNRFLLNISSGTTSVTSNCQMISLDGGNMMVDNSSFYGYDLPRSVLTVAQINYEYGDNRYYGGWCVFQNSYFNNVELVYGEFVDSFVFINNTAGDMDSMLFVSVTTQEFIAQNTTFFNSFGTIGFDVSGSPNFQIRNVNVVNSQSIRFQFRNCSDANIANVFGQPEYDSVPIPIILYGKCGTDDGQCQLYLQHWIRSLDEL
ncbi:hypothetical protein DFA_08812 [Cavenderia fasciculata]|uniref:Uncharacterized protein n=1 Tax=Cavenderia fasciculata TaxID=261658 RepID=F4Q4G3_CACFS|nr:uncharacterized protein DFA_08812 [Cavenderia fasciculata]EGG17812.1 hypothetical protein DFA_08812 [Cavenderia fasciculata]|eukprot:XP_004356296.1 hypothetical protein DFA_08812 [Cavenderia fasciculata]